MSQRLPKGPLDAAAITAAQLFVETKGQIAKSIRQAFASIQDPDFRNKVERGRLILGPAPHQLDSGPLRNAVFLGVVTYDQLLRSYVVRGQLGERLLVCDAARAVGARSSVHSLACTLVQVCAFEVALRRQLALLPTAPEFDKASAKEGDARINKAIAAALVSGGHLTCTEKVAGDLINQVNPLEITVRIAVQRRLKNPNASDLEMITATTFSELWGLANASGVVMPNEARQAIVDARNAVAHFRPSTIADASKGDKALQDALQKPE